MDLLSTVLGGPRARDVFVLKSVLRPPWSLGIQDEAPLSVVAVLRGGAWIERGPRRVELGHGDVAVVRGPQPYIVADRPDTEPQILVGPGQRCTSLDGRDLHDEMMLGVRTWGNDPGGSTTLLTGTYDLDGEVSRRLLTSIPAELVVRADEADAQLVGLLAHEVTTDQMGQQAVLDRLVDLLLVATLRTWFTRPGTHAPNWFRAGTDPVVGPALRLLHDHPARRWTVGCLASEVGVSRASLARRFTELVGEPPMTYLTEWRLALAADLLREPSASVANVAAQVGYGTPFAFSTAFKRRMGLSPSAYRGAA
jgi:AraC-like DNA-binding protein